MPEPRFPSVFVAADAAAMAGQRQFIRGTRLQLGLLVVAGGAGLFTLTTGELDASALVGGGAFSAAALLRIRLLRRGLHRIWYEGRAAAESIKTLSWRYAVAGDPFPHTDRAPAARLEEQVDDVLQGLSVPYRAAGDAAPTEWMETLRASPLTERQHVYLLQRVQDQVQWYSAKSRWNHLRARWWGVAIVVLQAAGAGGAFLKGFGVINFDIFGLAAALVGSAAAWLESRQHGSLASAYAVAADELRRIATLVEGQDAEEAWGEFVAEAEGAISREHTMWKASTSQRRPARLA